MDGRKLRPRDAARDLLLRCRLKLAGSGSRVLLCRPRGGLNDSLCQIEVCRRYALRYRRKLYVDGSRSGFHDNFGHYFSSASDVTFIDDPNNSVESVLTSAQTDFCNSYVPLKTRAHTNFVNEATGELLTFDFRKDHSEDLLLHEQCGGGTHSIRTLARLRLRPHVANRVRTTLQWLGDYDAVHVRNTDLTTDYQTLFHRIDRELNRTIVVCTDDHHCQAYAKQHWGSRLRVVNELVNSDRVPLHRYATPDQSQTNEQALVDLLVLASAKRLFASETTEGRPSGFTMLAMSLRTNPRVIKRLLSPS